MSEAELLEDKLAASLDFALWARVLRFARPYRRGADLACPGGNRARHGRCLSSPDHQMDHRRRHHTRGRRKDPRPQSSLPGPGGRDLRDDLDLHHLRGTSCHRDGVRHPAGRLCPSSSALLQLLRRASGGLADGPVDLRLQSVLVDHSLVPSRPVLGILVPHRDLRGDAAARLATGPFW